MGKKRIVGALLAAVLTVSMAACSGPGSSSSQASTRESSESSAAENSETGEPEEIVLTHWVTSAMQSDHNIRKEERFREKYPHIKLENVMVTDDQLSQLATAFASGTNPDFGEVGQPDMAKYAYAGMAMDLGPFIEKWEDLKNISEDALNNFKYGGKQFALPSYCYTMNLFYNKKLFEESGIKNPPATWEEYLETAKSLTIPEKQQWGTNLLVSQWTEWWFEYFVW